MAIEDGGLDLGAIDQTRFGVVVGSAFGGMQTFEEQTLKLDAAQKQVVCRQLAGADACAESCGRCSVGR